MLDVKLYGAWFYTGSFWIEVIPVGGGHEAKAMQSKNCKIVTTISGEFESLAHLLDSEDGEYAKEIIDKGEFDFLLLGHGGGVSYYLNHENGLHRCKAQYFEDNDKEI